MKYTCLQCGKEHPVIRNRNSKFCNTLCMANWQLVNITLPRFKQGLISGRKTIKRILIHLYGYKCAICDLSRWQDKDITLQVDHANGLANDNSPSNLRLLCPNCHSQTDSFCGANKGKGRGALGISRS